MRSTSHYQGDTPGDFTLHLSIWFRSWAWPQEVVQVDGLVILVSRSCHRSRRRSRQEEGGMAQVPSRPQLGWPRRDQSGLRLNAVLARVTYDAKTSRSCLVDAVPWSREALSRVMRSRGSLGAETAAARLYTRGAWGRQDDAQLPRQMHGSVRHGPSLRAEKDCNGASR